MMKTKLISGLKRTFLMIALATAAFASASPDYDDGKAALRERDWEAAVAAFARAAEMDPSVADAATYWRAYALFKSGKERSARQTLRNFERRFPDSRWRDDVRVLLAEHDEDIDRATDLESVQLDTETRLFLLARLMEQQPDRAMPLVRDMLGDREFLADRNVRRNLLFILAVSDESEAQQLIGEIARGSGDPKLQTDAIHVLGTSGTRRATQLITEIYRASDRREVKEAALQASVVADAPELALEILRDSRDPKLQLQAIQTLGVMDETDQLHRLYDQFKDRKVREAVLQALMVADDAAGLRRLIERERDPKLRRAAIRNLAITGELESTETLQELYDNARSTEEKHAVLEALHIIGDDAEDLALRIARQEQDDRLRARAIQALGVMGSDEALLSLYPSLKSKENRQVVIQSLMVAGADDELIELLEKEKDTELRATLIQNIAITDSDRAGEYLQKAYADAARQEKEAIISAMIVMDDAEPLIEMLKTERNRELKQRILQTLVMLDSDEATEYLLKALEEQR